MNELQRADSKARAKAVAIVVVGSLLGVAALALLQSQRDNLVTWMAKNPLRMKVSILGGVVLFLLVPLLLASVWAWRLGTRVVDEQRFPPDRFQVVRDTVVFQGIQARRRGRILQGLGVMFVVAGGGILWVAWKLVALLQR
jgi:hypothetical protein